MFENKYAVTALRWHQPTPHMKKKLQYRILVFRGDELLSTSKWKDVPHE